MEALPFCPDSIKVGIFAVNGFRVHGLIGNMVLSSVKDRDFTFIFIDVP